MEAANSSETKVIMYQFKRRHISKDSGLQHEIMLRVIFFLCHFRQSFVSLYSLCLVSATHLHYSLRLPE